nr:thioredoxin-like protein slr0233 [Tanacetum cinerariifolium]
MAVIVSSSSSSSCAAAAIWTTASSTNNNNNSNRLTCSVGCRFVTLTASSRLGWSSSHQKRRPRTLVQAKKQTFSSLDELLEQAEKPVLVDFYATWCGPCQFMGPILNEVSITMGDAIQVVKIDTEKYPEIANKYNIEALPTFILFKDGKPFDRFEGALTANQLIQRIEGTLKVEN